MIYFCTSSISKSNPVAVYLTVVYILTDSKKRWLQYGHLTIQICGHHPVGRVQLMKNQKEMLLHEINKESQWNVISKYSLNKSEHKLQQWYVTINVDYDLINIIKQFSGRQRICTRYTSKKENLNNTYRTGQIMCHFTERKTKSNTPYYDRIPKSERERETGGKERTERNQSWASIAATARG